MEVVKKINWDYKKKIGEMTEEELKKRIVEAYEWEMPKINTLPFVAEEDGELDEIYYYQTNELIARCPETGIPDYYNIEINIKPDKLIPELKSLKFYFLSYIDHPISHEHLARKIFKDIWDTIKPLWMHIHIDVNTRGGINTSVDLEKGEL